MYIVRNYPIPTTNIINLIHFDAELVETIIKEMKLGKAAGLDGLSVEHLINGHPILPGILARLFNLIIKTGHVPAQFGFELY